MEQRRRHFAWQY